MFTHILHPFVESLASVFATYSYFLEILKTSHLTANKKSHFPVVNTKAISLPLMNGWISTHLMSLCKNTKYPSQLTAGFPYSW